MRLRLPTPAGRGKSGPRGGFMLRGLRTALVVLVLALLGAAMQLRTQVANYYEYNKGPGLHDRLADLRKLATDAEINAVRVRLLVVGELGILAGRLATATTELAERTIEDTEQDLNAVKSDCSPEFGELDTCARNFRQAVTAEIDG